MTTTQTIHKINELKGLMKVKEKALNTFLIYAETNNISKEQLYTTKYEFENELMNIQEQINKLNTLTHQYILRFARH